MITVYESDNRFFVDLGSRTCEVSSATLQTWDKEGFEINLVHTEGKD